MAWEKVGTVPHCLEDNVGPAAVGEFSHHRGCLVRGSGCRCTQPKRDLALPLRPSHADNSRALGGQDLGDELAGNA